MSFPPKRSRDDFRTVSSASLPTTRDDFRTPSSAVLPTISKKQNNQQSVVPKSLSVLDMTKLGKLLKKHSKAERYVVESFNVKEKVWGTVGHIAFEVEDIMVGEGGFRKALKARSSHQLFKNEIWIIKKYKDAAKETIKELGDSIEDQTRKCVQMHSLTRSLAAMFTAKVKSVDDNFGGCHKIFFGKSDQQSVTIEKYIEGTFEKSINNDGVICSAKEELKIKAETFVHFTWEKSDKILL